MRAGCERKSGRRKKNGWEERGEGRCGMDARQELEKLIAEYEAQPEENWRGRDWCELSDEEEAVFEIDRRRFPRILAVWVFYQCVLDILGAWDFGFSKEAMAEMRGEFPEIRERSLSEKQWGDFGCKVGGLTRRECTAMYAKTEFWDVRDGLTKYCDEEDGET